MKKNNFNLKNLDQFEDDALLDFSSADEVRGGSYSMIFDESAEQAIFDGQGGNNKQQLTSWLKTVRLLLEED